MGYMQDPPLGDTMSLLNPLNIIQQLILHVNSDTIQLPSHYSNIFFNFVSLLCDSTPDPARVLGFMPFRPIPRM